MRRVQIGQLESNLTDRLAAGNRPLAVGVVVVKGVVVVGVVVD